MMEKAESKSKGLRMKLKSLQHVNQNEVIKPKEEAIANKEVQQIIETVNKPEETQRERDANNIQTSKDKKPVLAVNNNKNANRVNLLNRMNKDKEPMKLMATLQPPCNVPLESTTVKDPHPEPIKATNVEKPENKEKLLKRMASAKENLSAKENANAMAKKVSERIMGMAQMLQNKVHPGVSKPKFLLQDSDVQKVEGERENKELDYNAGNNVQISSNTESATIGVDNDSKAKEISNILMTKPVIKNKKKSKTVFHMKSD